MQNLYIETFGCPPVQLHRTRPAFYITAKKLSSERYENKISHNF